MSFDLSVIADSIYELHFSAELSHSDDGSGYVVHLKELKIKGQI